MKKPSHSGKAVFFLNTLFLCKKKKFSAKKKIYSPERFSSKFKRPPDRRCHLVSDKQARKIFTKPPWTGKGTDEIMTEKRKDLFDAYVLTEEDKKLLKEYDNKNE